MFGRRSAWLAGPGLVLVCCVGCQFVEPEPIKLMREAVQCQFTLASTLETVKDPESARAATPKLEPVFTQFVRVLERMIAVKDQYPTVRIKKSTATQLVEQMRDGSTRMAKQGERLRKIQGLPIEFWNVVRKGSAEVLARSLVLGSQGVSSPELKQHLDTARQMLQQHGPEQVVVLEVANLPAHLVTVVQNRLQAVLPGCTAASFADGPVCEFQVAPVKDYDRFVSSLQIGAIIFNDPPQRRVTVSPDLARLQGIPQPGQPQGPSPGPRSNVPSGFPSGPFPPGAMGMLPGGPPPGRPGAGKPPVVPPLPRHSERLDPSAPDYYDRLAERLKSDNPFERREAMEALLKVGPDDVPSAETRKNIARAFKDLAEDTHGPDRPKAIQGLVRWGGKFSVPILLQLLEERNPFVKEEIYKALGELADERAAGPVARRLGDFFDRDHALRCLRRMGAAAEPGLIEVAPSNDAQVSLTAIQLLGDMGTTKALPTLQRALQSRNPTIREAAKTAIRRIRERNKGASADAKVE